MTNVFAAPLAGDTSTVRTLDGTQLHATSAGTGRPVVLAHGYAVDSSEWNIIGAELVARGYRVIAFDQRGHGKSTIGTEGIGSRQMAADYAAVLEHFDVRAGILVMHSMGGFIGIRFLIENPQIVKDRISAAVLIATFAGDVMRKNPQNRLQIPLIRSGLMTRIANSRRVGTAFANTLLGEDRNPDMAEAFLNAFRQQDLKALTPILNAMAQENRYDRLNHIALPTTIIVGTHDRTTPPFHTQDLHTRIAGSTLIRIEGKGHMLNWESSDLITDEISRLAGITDAAT